ncbi:S-adenosylmethionine-dependent methyltransferase [Candidatus Hepatincola sp. Pdp]
MNLQGTEIKSKHWTIDKEDFQKLLENNAIYWAKGTPYGKTYLEDMKNKGQISNDFIGIEYGTNQNSTIQLDKLMGHNKVFNFPKPINLIKHFLAISTLLDKESLILDFFAGSGTTGHAVMQLNAEDGGNRKFILVQLDEKITEKSEAKTAGFHYISDITAERLRRASKKIAEELQAQPPTLNLEDKDENPKPLDLGFKFFKVDKPYFPLWNYNAKTQDELKTELKNTLGNLEQANRTDIQNIYEILNKLKLQLNCSIKPFTTSSSTKSNLYNIQYGNNGTNYDAIVIMDNISEDIVKEVLALKPVYLIILEKSFNGNNSLKINIETLLAKQDNIQVHYV